MKKIYLSLCLLFGTCCLSGTATGNLAKAAPAVQAEAFNNKTAHKAMFSVVTYNSKGDILHSGYGFFIDNTGTGVAAFSLFEGASRADVIDFKGDKLSVHRILGASSTYDLVKFSTTGAKKIEAFSVAQHVNCEPGTPLQLITYTSKKKAQPTLVNVKKAEDFNDYKYYELGAENLEKNLGCPLLDEAGHVAAVAQKNVAEGAKNLCAVDGRFINQLKITNMSILNSDLLAIRIPKGLPADEKDALTYIYMLGYKDSIPAINAINDFIATYPENAEGYTNRGTFYAQHKQYGLCDADFNKALELADNDKSTIKADDVHNKWSKLILNKTIYDAKSEIPNWTIDRAIEEAAKAYELNASPFHLMQQAHCFLQKKEFKKAYENYYNINTKSFPNHKEWSAQAKIETWTYATRAYEMGMKNGEIPATMQDTLHLIALVDSTIAALPKPYIKEDARFFFERAQRYQQINQFRKAALDYYEYEKIIGPKNLNDKFYYLREQVELKARMYQQALDDIRTAMAYNPKDPFYPVEEALILLNAGLYKEAIAACEKHLKLIPENPDCYKIMGIAYGELKKKKEALLYLKKAQGLGDPTVAPFIQKYQ